MVVSCSLWLYRLPVVVSCGSVFCPLGQKPLVLPPLLLQPIRAYRFCHPVEVEALFSRYHLLLSVVLPWSQQ